MSTTTDRLVTVHGEGEFVARAGHLLAGAREEFVCSATDLNTWSGGGARKPVGSATRRLQIPVFKMFRPPALADEESERHLVELSRRGAQVRICDAPLPHEMIMIDRRVLILAGPPSAPARAFTIIRAADVILGISSLFWATWESATELANFRRDRPPALTDQSRAILTRLGAGLKDETAARQLGLSLRTYRRRVAELMTLLGAETRFQAGIRARELGL